jgi:cation transport ATPase
MSTGSTEDLRTRLQEIDPYEFEDFVAELWEEEGWETEVTDDGKDKGVDIAAEREGAIGQEIVIQVKRYSDGNRITRPNIQQYYSLRDQEGVDAVVVVTTSEFASPAYEWADEHNVKLVNGDDLVEMIRDHGRHDLVEEYAPSPNQPDDKDESEPTATDTTSESNVTTGLFSTALVFIAQAAAVSAYFGPETWLSVVTNQMAIYLFLGAWLAAPFTVLRSSYLVQQHTTVNIKRVQSTLVSLVPVLGIGYYTVGVWLLSLSADQTT